MLGYFPFNLSKNNAVLEPRTGHFRGFEGYRGRGQDRLTPAKAKDFKMCPRGQGRLREVHLCCTYYDILQLFAKV